MLKSLITIWFITFNIIYGETIHVPTDQPTIQAGIDSVMNGDTVLVSPGYYTENINFNGKDIVVGSFYLTTEDTAFISQTTIDGNKNGSVVVFEMGENLNSTLSGFTVTNGTSLYGGGIRIVNSSPTIVSNYIIENTVTFDNNDLGMGGGIYVLNGSPAIIKNKVSNNVNLFNDSEDSGHGGGIYLENSSSEIKDNIITHNVLQGPFGRGGGIYSEGNPIIENNVISNNIAGESGGGIYLSAENTIIIKNNTISSNSLNDFAETQGDGILCYSKQSLEISDNTFVNNGIKFNGNHISTIITGNTFENFSDVGFDRTALSISGTSASVKTIIIENNLFSHFSAGESFIGAISISGTGDAINSVTIENNIFENIKGYAISLGGTGNAAINGDILNNIIKNCASEAPHFLPAIDIGGTGGVKINSVVSGNLITGSDGTAISIGGISSSQQNGVFANNTISNNSIGISKGANVNNLEIVNSIIMGNKNDLENVPLTDVRYSNIGDAGYSGYNGNMTLNPMFINTAGGNYSLQNSSPCIDAGDPFYDYSQEPFYNGKRINIGAYGNTDQATVSSPEIELSIQELTFTPLRVNWSDSLNFWIRNHGLTRLNIDSVLIDTSVFRLNSVGSDFVFPGDSLEVTIKFNPSLPGEYEADITILSNDEDEGITKIKVSGSSFYQYSPLIKNINDISNDQGRWVKVRFYNSDYDTDSLIFPKSAGTELYTIEIDDGSGWIAAATTGAYGKPLYSVLTPTTKDSTSESSGMIYFRVIANMVEGNFVSLVDSGYSVDNLTPSVPTGLFASLITGPKVKLNWLPNTENDFKFYSIYRSKGTEFERIQQTIDIVITDLDVQSDENYSYAITATDHSGNESPLSEKVDITVTGLEEESKVPNRYYLAQNYPNPFNPTTTIKYGLKKSGFVKIYIFDLLGNKIREIVNSYQNAGHHKFIWSGENTKNEKVSSGVFFYQIITAEFKQNKKMLFIK